MIVDQSAAATSTERHLVFVYGSLLPGERLHAALEHARHLGPARTVAEYELMDMGVFPAMVEGGQTAISGELYLVSDDDLALIDLLEGHPEFFLRTTVRLDDDRECAAWLLNPARKISTNRRIASGDWRRRHQARPARKAVSRAG